jgi:hypothetical protein
MTDPEKRPDYDIPEDPDEEEGVPAPWPFKLLMTLVPFALVAALLFADQCSGT